MLRPDQVFQVVGRVEDHGPLQRTIVIAPHVNEAIDALHNYGLRVHAITSLEDVLRARDALLAILNQDPDVEDNEYIDLGAPRLQSNIWTFAGHPHHLPEKIFAGFAVSASQDELVTYMDRHAQFTVTTTATLHDLAATTYNLRRVAAGAADELEYIDLFAISSAA